MDVVCDSSSSSHLDTHLVVASRHLALLALFTLVVGDTLVTLRSADVFTMTMHPALVTHIGTRSTFLAWIFGWDRWVDSDGWTGGHEQQRKQLHDQLHHCVQMFVPAGGEWVLLRCEARGRNPWAWAESLANKSITHCEVLDILIFPASGRCARISTQSYQIPDGRGVKFSGWPHLLTHMWFPRAWSSSWAPLDRYSKKECRRCVFMCVLAQQFNSWLSVLHNARIEDNLWQVYNTTGISWMNGRRCV